MIVNLHEVLDDDDRIVEVQVVGPDQEVKGRAPTRNGAMALAKSKGWQVGGVQPQLMNAADFLLDEEEGALVESDRPMTPAEVARAKIDGKL